MSDRSDLTRWNRAGLRHFRYIDGNAVEFLETLRQELAGRLPGWDEVKDLALPGETERQRLDRIEEQYRRERGSWAWEISRSFARACHILAEYADAYANEGYLGTASQWDNVRRLVGMLGYHPAPPASALTYLVLLAKADMAGKVAKGFQLKYAPAGGGKPVVFETLDDLDIDAAFNALQPADWNKSQLPLDGATAWYDADGKGVGELDLSAGDVGILLNTDDFRTAKALTITDVDRSSHSLSGLPSWNGLLRYQARLLAGAKAIRPVNLYGKDVVVFEKPHGLSAGDVVAWQAGAWHFNEVKASDMMSVRLNIFGAFPAPNDVVYRLSHLDKTGGQPIGSRQHLVPA